MQFLRESGYGKTQLHHFRETCKSKAEMKRQICRKTETQSFRSKGWKSQDSGAAEALRMMCPFIGVVPQLTNVLRLVQVSHVNREHDNCVYCI